jgi:hypothetical protein
MNKSTTDSLLFEARHLQFPPKTLYFGFRGLRSRHRAAETRKTGQCFPKTLTGKPRKPVPLPGIESNLRKIFLKSRGKHINILQRPQNLFG